MAPLLMLLALLAPLPQAGEPETLWIERALHHLGNDVVAEWAEVSAEPEGTHLAVVFEAPANGGEWVLELVQRDVNERWTVRLNGAEIGTLRKSEPELLARLRVPAGTLRDGENELLVESDVPADDVVLGAARLRPTSLSELLQLGQVEIRVRDAATERPLPARIGLFDASGAPAELWDLRSALAAARPGIAYTGDGALGCTLPAGRYTIHAVRGVEWGHAQGEIEVVHGGEARLELALAREVATPGYVAADTHIHTVTFSGHGDAELDERVITLAGEGVELAVATDHNHHTDYRPAQERLGLSGWYTPVTGNEVTTKHGHVNAFPLDPAGPLPDHELADWVALVEDIRAKGAKVAILNHPRWPDLERGPFGAIALERSSGEWIRERTSGRPLPFDAMELANATALLDEADFLLVDWFALLDAGERLYAVGSSDSHTVGDPVGQGRTYVRSSSDDPTRISVDEVCDAFVDGDMTTSLGIYVELTGADGLRPGALVPATDRRARFDLRVAAPAWIRPERLTVYVNGFAAREVDLARSAAPGEPFERRFALELELPPHDCWLVCFVTGPGVDDPCWRTMKPYTLAATNPLWLDVDGDGAYASPNETARTLLERAGVDPSALAATFRGTDGAVRVQALALARVRDGFGPDALTVLAGPSDARDPRPRRYFDALVLAAASAASETTAGEGGR